MAGYGILVGVTGRGENSAALRWADREARVHRLPVTLVHVVEPVLPPPPPNLLLSYEDVIEVGQQRAREVAEEYAALTGALTGGLTGGLTGEPTAEPTGGQAEDGDGAPGPVPLVRRGHAAHVLAGMSSEAELVVLQHRDISELRRIVTGSTAVSVAAHGHAPVVSVPGSWTLDGDGSPEPAGDRSQWVTVGTHEAGVPAAVLQAGFEEAVAHGWSVRLAHAWRLDPGYDDAIVRRAHRLWEQRVADGLRAAVEPLTGTHPGVRVELEVRNQWPADALAELSGSSELLVVGRHSARPLLPHRIGSIARTMLRAAACPVMVVPV